MKLALFCTALALMIAPTFAADAPPGAADIATADKEIRARAQEFSAAWQKHDPALVAAFYAPDGDMVTGQGRAYAGRDAIEEALRGAFDGGLKDSAFVWTVEKIKLVKPDVAVVDYEAQIKGTDANAEGVKFHIVAVLIKQGGKWLTQTTRGIVYSQQ
jgi:uncharacterized protein (TIGR02246 family)